MTYPGIMLYVVSLLVSERCRTSHAIRHQNVSRDVMNSYPFIRLSVYQFIRADISRKENLYRIYPDKNKSLSAERIYPIYPFIFR
jgi:hypothetical protein